MRCCPCHSLLWCAISPSPRRNVDQYIRGHGIGTLFQVAITRSFFKVIVDTMATIKFVLFLEGISEILSVYAFSNGLWYLQVVVFTGEAPLIGRGLSAALDQMGFLSIVILFVTFSFFGMLLNWSMFLCTMCNSALTTTIVGVLKVRFDPYF